MFGYCFEFSNFTRISVAVE